MPELTPEQQRKLEKLARVVNDGDLAILDHLFELETQIDDKVAALEAKLEAELPGVKDIISRVRKDIISRVRGDKGEAPTKEELLAIIKPLIPNIPKVINGENYVLTEQDKREIASKIKVPVVEHKTVIEKTEVIRETPVITNNIVEKALYDTAENIVDKINTLPIEPEYQIEKEHIKGLDEIERLAREPKGRTFGGGLSQMTADLRYAPISSGGVGAWSTPPETPKSDGSVTTYTVGTTIPTDVVADGATYFSGFGYTYSSPNITFDNGPTQYVRFR